MNPKWVNVSYEQGDTDAGYGTPTYAAPEGTIYQKLDGTTTGHTYRRTSSAWAAMSDD